MRENRARPDTKTIFPSYNEQMKRKESKNETIREERE